MKVREDTENLFIQDKDGVIEYLNSRGVFNQALDDVIRKYSFGLLEGATFIANGEQYEISHFLTKSEIVGYDIKKANDLIGISDTKDVAFAVVLGDDALCYDSETGEVYVWLMQTGDGEKIEASSDLTSFINNLTSEEDK